MSRFRMRNVILPAILVSSGVFSILTLPIVLKKAGPLWREPQLLMDEPAPTFFERDNKNAIIRYVGGAIVVSVGAGIATIEILRRLHPSNRLSKDQKDSLNSKIRQLEAEGASDPALLSESVENSIYDLLSEEFSAAHWSESQAIVLSNKNSFDTEKKENSIALDHPLQSPEQSSFDAQASNPTYRNGHDGSRSANTAFAIDSASDAVAELSPLERALSFADPSASMLDWPEVSADQAAPEATSGIDSPPGQLETYRIKVPHRQDSLFAILVEGQYYSLVRTHPSKERILEVAAKLRQQGDEVLITTVEQRYAVWVLQPEAYLELVS
jgi:hypothetical protein